MTGSTIEPTSTSTALTPGGAVKPKLLIVQNSPRSEEVTRLFGTFDAQITQCLTAFGIASDNIALDCVRTYDHDIERLPLVDVTQYFAVILSGSKFDVTQGLPWMHTLAAWIHRNVGKVPMLGICFGHQIMAHALGGEVAINPQGVEYGTYEVTDCEHSRILGASDPLVSRLPRSFKAQLIHSQSVERLPDGAVSFYRTPQCANQMIRFMKDTYGTQFHPEFCPGYVKTMIQFCPSGWFETEEIRQRLSTIDEAPIAATIVGLFVQLYMPRE